MKRNNNKALYEKIMRNVSKQVKQALNEDYSTKNYSTNNIISYAISNDCKLSRQDFDDSEYRLNIYGQATTIFNSIIDFQQEVLSSTGFTAYDLINDELWIWFDEGEEPEDIWAYDTYSLKSVKPSKGGGQYAIFDISDWSELELSEWDHVVIEG